jgi:hypothetical protein
MRQGISTARSMTRALIGAVRTTEVGSIEFRDVVVAYATLARQTGVVYNALAAIERAPRSHSHPNYGVYLGLLSGSPSNDLDADTIERALTRFSQKARVPRQAFAVRRVAHAKSVTDLTARYDGGALTAEDGVTAIEQLSDEFLNALETLDEIDRAPRVRVNCARFGSGNSGISFAMVHGLVSHVARTVLVPTLHRRSAEPVK